MTQSIDVRCEPAPGGWTCRVEVGGPGPRRRHVVSVAAADLARLAPGPRTPRTLSAVPSPSCSPASRRSPSWAASTSRSSAATSRSTSGDPRLGAELAGQVHGHDDLMSSAEVGHTRPPEDVVGHLDPGGPEVGAGGWRRRVGQDDAAAVRRSGQHDEHALPWSERERLERPAWGHARVIQWVVEEVGRIVHDVHVAATERRCRPEAVETDRQWAGIGDGEARPVRLVPAAYTSWRPVYPGGISARTISVT